MNYINNYFFKFIIIVMIQLPAFAISFGEYEYEFHGKFCGDNIPNVSATSKKHEYKLLSEIEPIDVVDQACKRHDLCYLERGENDEICDAELVEEVAYIHKYLETKDCRRFSESIVYYFKVRNDNMFTLIDDSGSVFDRMTKLPSTTFKNMVRTASISKMAGENYMFSKPYGYIFDSKNNKQRRKEVLQIFPPRYKKCEVSSDFIEYIPKKKSLDK